MTYEGKHYEKFSDDQVETLFVCGELPSGTFKTGSYTEYISPPTILSRERYSDSVQWWHGKYVHVDQISKASKVPLKFSRPYGVGAAQPNKYVNSTASVVANFVIFLVALLIGIIIFWKRTEPVGELIAKAKETNVPSLIDSLKSGVNIDSLITQATVPYPEYSKSESFVVASDGTALGINFSSSVMNSWVTVELIIVNETTGEQISTWQDIEYYTGVDEGTTWHEGSQKPSMIVSSLDAGKYHVLAKGDQGPLKYQQIVSLDLVLNPPIKSNFALFLILGMLVPLLNFFLRKNFEHRRWSKSEFAE